MFDGLVLQSDVDAIERAALDALNDEIKLFPKPGLVSPIDSGAHADMDFHTFVSSIDGLSGYFTAIAQAGAENRDFHRLKDLGIEAERAMMNATGGVNTHRGAIFSMGLLAAAAGWNRARGMAVSAQALGLTVAERWGADIARDRPPHPISNGARAANSYGARGARDEAINGFPVLRTIAMPLFFEAKSQGADTNLAGLNCLFGIMAQLDDTNLLHRGGPQGLTFAQGQAREFIQAGGVFAPDWEKRAIRIHRAFIARNLSPGGSADILAAAYFVHNLSGS